MAQSNGTVQDQRPSVLAGTISTLVIATLFVSARMLTRLWIVKRPGLDDGWILFAWVRDLRNCLGFLFSAFHQADSLYSIDSGIWTIILNLLRDFQGPRVTFDGHTGGMAATARSLYIRIYCSIRMPDPSCCNLYNAPLISY
jgi:hypothetical protein